MTFQLFDPAITIDSHMELTSLTLSKGQQSDMPHMKDIKRTVNENFIHQFINTNFICYILCMRIDICGKRGLGDMVAGISRVLQTVSEEPHDFFFHYPPGFDYPTTINVIMNEYVCNKINSVHVSEEWYSISIKPARKRFGEDNYNKTWFFTYCKGHRYSPFKTQWKQNTNGPVGLMLNNENMNENYPYPEKWFPDNVNSELMSLIDNKNFYALGRPRSVKDNIDLMAECSYILGVDGAWVHVANSMRVPCYLARNNLAKNIVWSTHSAHPTLKLIGTEDVIKKIKG